jgi:hypothetical protein
MEVRTAKIATRVVLLLRRGFSARGAYRYAAQFQRHEEKAFPGLEVTSRLVFVCWLVDHGRLSDELPELTAVRAASGTAPESAHERRTT